VFRWLVFKGIVSIRPLEGAGSKIFFSIFNFFPNLGVMTYDLFNIANVFEKCYYASGRLFRSKKVKTHALGKVCFFLYKIFFQLGDLI